MPPDKGQLVVKLGGHWIARVQSQELLYLRAQDVDSDPGGEASNDRYRDVLDHHPHSRNAHGDQKKAREHRANHEATHAVAMRDADHHRNESSGGATNLHPRSAQH